MKFQEFLERYIHVRPCPGCTSRVSWEHAEDAFCTECREKWDRAKTESCKNCFQAYSDCVCMPKRLEHAGALVLRKLLRYSSKRQKEPQNRILYVLKRKPNRRYSRFLASELLPLVREELKALEIESSEALLTYIPRGRKSNIKYGTDQSESVTRALSVLCEVPFANTLHRKWGGKEQKRLSARERQKNLRQLFSVEDPSLVKGKVVLLFDDVVTSGASMATCVSLLKKAGASAVLCFCVAQTE
ncbi:MAG: ComF family protein [Clostridia bacterium]|nr:ComF family protein [Clostridia bacterium]